MPPNRKLSYDLSSFSDCDKSKSRMDSFLRNRTSFKALQRKREQLKAVSIGHQQVRSHDRLLHCILKLHEIADDEPCVLQILFSSK